MAAPRCCSKLGSCASKCMPSYPTFVRGLTFFAAFLIVFASLFAFTFTVEFVGKLSECDIKYTPWSNLRKGSDMDTGTIGTPPRSPRAFAPPDVDERRHQPYHASAAAPPQHQQARCS